MDLPKRVCAAQATGVDAAGRRQYRYHPAFRPPASRRSSTGSCASASSSPPCAARSRRTSSSSRTGATGPARSPSRSSTAGGSASARSGRPGPAGRTASRRSRSGTSPSAGSAWCSGSGQAPGARPHDPRRRRDRGGGEVAPAIRRRGAPAAVRPRRAANLTAAGLNAYIAGRLGDVHGEGLPHVGRHPDRGDRAGRARPTRGCADEQRVLAAVMRRVGHELGNTRPWRARRTSARRDRAVARRPHARPVPGPQAAGRVGQRGLLDEEAALVSLLRSWRIRRAQRLVAVAPFAADPFGKIRPWD